MNIAVLTSSRADFGIYMPLLKKIKNDQFFNLDIVVFGTHLSRKHGYTKNEILSEGFKISYEIKTLCNGSKPIDINNSISKVFKNFGKFWEENNSYFDLVLCLGDRFEMFAAVFSGISFGIKFAHIHAGEKTLGAFDNIFRHSITHASIIHYTSTNQYSKRVFDLLDINRKNIHNVGALSLDNITEFKPFSKTDMFLKFGIKFNSKTILVTLHPETTSNEIKNRSNVRVIANLVIALKEYSFIITMPNADTFSEIIRDEFNFRLKNCTNVFLIENFGKDGYFNAMYYSSFLLGNSSSGIIEAASFKKYVINLGDRQTGRLHGQNVINCRFNENEISKKIKIIESLKPWNGKNIYYNGGAADKIITILKNYNGTIL